MILFSGVVEFAVAFLLVLVLVALGQQDLGVNEFEVGTFLNVRYATLNVLLFKTEYLILCDLPTEINGLVLWTEQRIVILRVTETVNFDVYRVVCVSVVCVLVLL